MLVLTVLLHGVFVWLLWYSMRSPLKLLDSSAPHDEAIELSLIRSPRAAPTPPPVAAPPPVLPLDHRTREISRNTMQVQLGHAPSAPPRPASTPPPAAPPKLFDATGNIVLNPQTAPAPAATGSDYVQRAPQGDTQVMQHNAGQQYKSAPNQFNQYFPPPKETLMHGVMRRLNGSDSNTKDVELGHGLRVKCKKVFGIPTPDCHMPPPPPPSNDGDERLNMAPAALLPHAPQTPAPSVQQCIAWYKAGKPLPHGCPVDTPARAAVSGP